MSTSAEVPLPDAIGSFDGRTAARWLASTLAILATHGLIAWLLVSWIRPPAPRLGATDAVLLELPPPAAPSASAPDVAPPAAIEAPPAPPEASAREAPAPVTPAPEPPRETTPVQAPSQPPAVVSAVRPEPKEIVPQMASPAPPVAVAPPRPARPAPPQPPPPVHTVRPQDLHRPAAPSRRTAEPARRPASSAGAPASSAARPAATTIARPGAPVADPAAVAAWRGQLAAHLNRFKHFPSGASAGIASVRVLINRGGQVLSASLSGGSGDSALDIEAVAIVRRASPVPPPPAGYAGPLGFVMPVRFSR